LLPGVNANGDYARTRVSENGVAGGLARTAGAGLETDYIAAGFDASWEVDVFGGVCRGVEAANVMLPTFAQHALWRPKAREMIGNLMEARDKERLRQEIQHGVRLAKSLGLDIADVALPF